MNSIAIIGAGNMGGAIIKGIVKSKYLEPSKVFCYDISDAVLSSLKKLNVLTFSSTSEAVKDADYILLAVKPFLIKEVLKSVKSSIKSETKIISIAAGISSSDIKSVIGEKNEIVLCMPNTGISVLESMTCISSSNASDKTINEVKSLFDNLGSCFLIEEKMMGAATAIAGCGPAFADRFIRAIMLAGTEMGFKPELAKNMAAQVLLGTAKNILETNSHPEPEIDKVTTPGGITITALNEMEHNGFSSSVIKGLIKAFEKVSKK